jgi:RNA polymerase sigma-70 factor (sigma-E family)
VSTTSEQQLDLARLYELHRLPLVRLAVLLVDEVASAEDVVHDAFINLYSRRADLRDQQAALGYLRVCVVNGARSVLRRRRTVRDHLRRTEATVVPAADTEALLAADEQQVLEGLRRLPARQREVLTLRYWSELSEAEIAAALGISRGSVKTHASRGMATLEQLLGDER